MPGDLVHVEIVAKDGEKARKFYSSLLGWKFGESGMPGMDYCMTENSKPVVAVYTDKEPKGPIVYFAVDDIDKAIATARKNGGKAEAKIPIPGQGWFSSCVDPDGNEFCVFQEDHAVTMPEQPAVTGGATR
jgi:predicted enzyme related to lactoylglutathione lyase